MIRPGGTADVRFLRDMLRHAYYWRSAAPDAPMEDSVQRYVNGWGRPGDAAVIAIERTGPVGAAWYRLFPPGEPGYGFVDEQTPELSIAVVPGRRGRGYGDELLAALLDRARKAGYERVSLSVAQDNPARKLYERHGFKEVSEGGGSLTMIAELGSPQSD
ncbi:MAG: GNAT family N-acetyltransferase [Actinomycetota bacterium]|nr:GNAT family N-acetyltransferase [Actinomycetota bacterium]